MDKKDPIVENIRIEMLRRFVNSEEMAAQMYISLATFYKRMANPNNFTIGELRAGAKFLKMDVGDLIRRHT